MNRVCFQVVGTVLLFTNPVASGEDEQRDVAQQVAEAFQVARDSLGHQNYSAAISKKLLKEHPKEVLEALKLYENDPVAAIRRGAYRFVYRLGVSGRDPEIRQEVTWRLVNACNDSDAWQMASTFLLSFEEADFTPASKAILHELLMEEPLKGDIIWIAGIAGMREELPRLKSLLIDESLYEARAQIGKWYGTVSWRARLARARMGVGEDLERALELVEREKNGSTRVGKLLRHLGYTRQPVAFEYIAKYLDSEGRMPPVKRNDPGSLYAQYAMDVLAYNLPGFPAKKENIGGHTRAEIDQASEWMKNHSWEPSN